MATFAELKASMLARGFNRLTDTQRGEYINDAVTEVDGMLPWPYRLAVATGAAPLVISALGEIDTVTDTVQDLTLDPVTFNDIAYLTGDPTMTGPPMFYYVDWSGTTQTVRVFPVATNNLSVRHWAFPTPLSAAGDTPAAPSRFHRSVYLPVACRMAMSDSGGDPTRFQAEADRGLEAMVSQLLPDQVAGVRQRVTPGASLDW